MDCEKFESAMLDELYGELDEVTSAALRRHAAGCSRCAALFEGLRETKKAAALPKIAPPADLEAKIFARVRDAQNVLPFRAKVQRAVAIGGSWAMRPQAAMAALFLLMIGSSVVLLRGNAAKSRPDSSAMRVEERGEPAPMAAASAAPAEGVATTTEATADLEEKVDDRLRNATVPTTPPASPAATGRGEDPSGALAGLEPRPLDSVPEPAKRKSAAYDAPLGAADKGSADGYGVASGALKDNWGGGNVAPPPPPAAAQAVAPAAAPRPKVAMDEDDRRPKSGGAESPNALEVKPSGGPSAPSVAKRDDSKVATSDTFATAMASYKGRQFDEATRAFDAVAATGDTNAALMAARAVREGHGCTTAVTRFDQVASRAFGSLPGYDATLEGGQCYRAIGGTDAARARFTRLLAVPSHASRAQAEINAMTPKGEKAVRAMPATKPVAPSKKADGAD
ncbi:MAG: zf-HC2 domain-containing protein [Polyangiaceae bacterium]